MILAKFIIELRYPDNVPDLFLFRQSIVSALTEEIKPPEKISDGMKLYVKKKKMSIVIESTRVGIDILLPRDQDFAIDNAYRSIRLLNSKLNINQVNRIGVRSIWYKNYSDSFVKLVELFKNKFYKSNELLKNAIDISVPFTLKNEEDKINYNFSPIIRSQLVQVVGLIPEIHGPDSISSLPDSSIMLDYDYFSDVKTKFTNDLLKRFIEKAMLNCQSTMLLSMKILENV